MTDLTSPNGFQIVFSSFDAGRIGRDRHRSYRLIVSTVHLPRTNEKNTTTSMRAMPSSPPAMISNHFRNFRILTDSSIKLAVHSTP